MRTDALLTLSFACLSVIATAPRYAAGQNPFQAVPKASCGPGERTETVQGETTLAERFSSGPGKAYRCNLELVGQFEGEGAAADLERLDHCAYYTTAPNPRMRHPGVVVLDVSDSRHPSPTAYLDSLAMRGAHESLAIEPVRKLLLGSQLPSTFDLYDLSTDCRHPVLIKSLSLPGAFAHTGQFTADGRTYYGAKWPPDPKAPPPSAVFALDLTTPASPRTLATWIPPRAEWITHAVSVNREGTRTYVALKRIEDDQEKAASPNGLVILDTSDIQARRPQPHFRVISTLFWNDSHEAEQLTAPVTIRDRPYVIVSDGVGAIGIQTPPPPQICDSGRPGQGFARLIDIGDEQHPMTASELRLEVAEPRNCSKVMHDPTLFGGYGAFACTPDHETGAQLLACAYFEGGLRVFDVRNPRRPAEVAYYKPPARRRESRPGSLFFTDATPGAIPDHTADSVITVPRFAKNGEEIWFSSIDNGFQVVRFTDHFKASHLSLFRH